jgi:hypothetical protein
MEGPSPEQMTAQANLRGSVGGVQGILSIQASVSQGLTGYDSGVAILTEIYGFSPETARQVLGKPIIQDTSQNDENINNTQDGTGQTDENIQEPNQ